MKSSVDLEKPPLLMSITKRKGDFMKNCSFGDNENELLYDIPPDRGKTSEFCSKDAIDKSTLCGPCYAEHEVNFSPSQ